MCFFNGFPAKIIQHSKQKRADRSLLFNLAEKGFNHSLIGGALLLKEDSVILYAFVYVFFPRKGQTNKY
jgi:hypothetical protein